jgi:hypothetical protein
MHSAQRTTRSHVHGAGGERGAGRERKGGRTHRLVVTRIHHVRVAGSESRVLPGLSVEERVVVLDADFMAWFIATAGYLFFLVQEAVILIPREQQEYLHELMA